MGVCYALGQSVGAYPVSKIVVIDTVESLVRVVDQLSQFSRVCLDTEVNAMFAYRPRVCLVQLCAATESVPAEEVFVVDALATKTLEPLQPLLGSHHTTPIIHDVSYDARMLFTEGMRLERAIDTALHARFLGLASTGLGHFLKEKFGVITDKEFQRADWGVRPLTEQQLEYVALDVAYLSAIAQELEESAIAADIHEEVVEETAWALRSAMQQPDPEGPPPYASLKGTREMTPESRAILRAMWDLRDGYAKQKDVPPGRILGGQLLVHLARSRPRDLESFRSTTAAQGRELSDEMVLGFVQCMTEGEQAGDVPENERAHFLITKSPSGEIAKRRAREDRLSLWRQEKATARTVNPQVVLPGHVLSEIARKDPRTLDELARVDGFGAVRMRRYGEELLGVLTTGELPLASAPKSTESVDE